MLKIDPEKARTLCSEAEFELFSESCEPALLKFTAEGLKKRALQAQKLHELWHGKVEDEKRAGFGTVGSARKRATTVYLTSRQKAELFEEVWRRYDTRLRMVLQDPNAPVKDQVKFRKATGKLNNG